MRTNRAKLSRRSFISAAMAFVLAATMFGFATPAFADDTTTGTINYPPSITIGQGQSINLLTTNTVYATGTNGDYHLDFGLEVETDKYGPSDAYASVNKHSGVLTGTAVTAVGETATLYVWLTPGNAPTGNSEYPCFASIGDPITIPITVETDSGYGYQGLDNAILMYSPTPDHSTLVGDSWMNTYDTPLAYDDAGYIHFTYTSLAGFNGKDEADYADDSFNGKMVEVLDSEFVLVDDGTLDNYHDPNAVLTFSTDPNAFDPSTSTLTLFVNTNELKPGQIYYLHFDPGFRGNNASRTLEQHIYFQFTFLPPE